MYVQTLHADLASDEAMPTVDESASIHPALSCGVFQR